MNCASRECHVDAPPSCTPVGALNPLAPPVLKSKDSARRPGGPYRRKRCLLYYYSNNIVYNIIVSVKPIDRVGRDAKSKKRKKRERTKGEMEEMLGRFFARVISHAT